MVRISGAPDHTVLAEQSFAHYKDVILTSNWANVGTHPDWTEIINVDIRGVWGYLNVQAGSDRIHTRVTIDGQIVFDQPISLLFDNGFYGFSPASTKYGCNVYNRLPLEELFSMFYNEEWGLYIHQNLTIQMKWGNGWGASTLARHSIHYKELT